MYDVLDCGERETDLGPATLIRIHRVDMRPMGWRELWEVFAGCYPGHWALQMFPPEHLLMDQANKYHLFVLPREDFDPRGLDIGDKSRVVW